MYVNFNSLFVDFYSFQQFLDKSPTDKDSSTIPTSTENSSVSTDHSVVLHAMNVAANTAAAIVTPVVVSNIGLNTSLPQNGFYERMII